MTAARAQTVTGHERAVARERLWELLRGALATRALALAADLRVADALADGPRPVEDVAREVGADADTLHRVLRALAGEGVFAETEPGVFRNTDASDVLRRGDGWDDFAHLFGGVWLGAAGALDATSREPAFPRLFGTDFWSWLADHPAERAAFDRAMAAGRRARASSGSRPRRGAATRPWSTSAAGTARSWPGCSSASRGCAGSSFDLPETNRDEAALGERCTFVAGSFFEHVPAGEVYVLATILHDWDDERAAAILRTIRAAAPPDARLLVLDTCSSRGTSRTGRSGSTCSCSPSSPAASATRRSGARCSPRAASSRSRCAEGLIEARCR